MKGSTMGSLSASVSGLSVSFAGSGFKNQPVILQFGDGQQVEITPSGGNLSAYHKYGIASTYHAVVVSGNGKVLATCSFTTTGSSELPPPSLE